MTCYNCGELGYFVGICPRLKICFICGIPGHHMVVCPKWKGNHPTASYMGIARKGIGFCHLDVPDQESTQWLNTTNCGVVKIKTRQILLTKLEAELSDNFCKEWPWP